MRTTHANFPDNTVHPEICATGLLLWISGTGVGVSMATEKGEPLKIVIENGYLGDGDKRRVVYVQDVGGSRTLDLYSGAKGQEGGGGPAGESKRIPICLTRIPPEVCECVSLERLWLSHNRLSSLPTCLPDLVNLRELFLHHNELSDIPVSLCKLRSLEILWLGNNRITRIPLEITGLSCLRRLHLDNNEVEEFPEFLCEMSQLQILYLNGNRISKIPVGITKCTNLQRLYLHKNKIKRLPLDLIQLVLQHNLTSVTLDDNGIAEWPRSFKEDQATMTEMGRAITLEGNPILPLSHSSADFSPVSRRYSDNHRPPHHALGVPRPTRSSPIPPFRLSESMST